MDHRVSQIINTTDGPSVGTARPKRLFSLDVINNQKISELGMARKFRDSTHYKPNATIVILLKEKKVGEILQPFHL